MNIAEAPCVLCMREGGDPVNGGYCPDCREPLDVSVGPAALVEQDIARAFPGVRGRGR